MSYAVQGSAADVAFGAFNSLGQIFLLFGLTVLLEIQASKALAGHRVTRKLTCTERPRTPCPSPCSLPVQSTLRPAPLSAVPPMVKATVVGYCVLLALFLAVRIRGGVVVGSISAASRCVDLHSLLC